MLRRVALIALLPLLVLGWGTASLSAGATGTAAPVTASWTEATPATVPSASYSAFMAAAPGGHLLMVQSSEGGGTSSTWSWSGSDWTQISTTHTVQYPTGVVYDAKLGAIIAYDAVNKSTVRWTGSDWVELVSGSGPSWSHGSMAYNAVDGTIIYFGGLNFSNTETADTWSFDGTQWTQLHPATSPPGRMMALMQLDPVTNQPVLFSGFVHSTQRNLDDTWTWNGSTWVQLHPVTSPPGRNSAASFVDQKVQRFFIEGGVADGLGVANDLWNWTGDNWNQVSLSSTPTQRYDQVAGYDPATMTDVLFGGFMSSPPAFSDTWILTTTSAPSTPSGVSVLGTSGSSALVSWQTSFAVGGPGLSYRATAQPGGATCTSASTSCTLDGLAKGTTYSISVVATNSIGSSDASAPATLVLTSDQPQVDPFASGGTAPAGVGDASTYAVSGFAGGTQVEIFVNGISAGTAPVASDGSVSLSVVWSDPHVSINGGPLIEVAWGPVSIGVSGTGTDGTARSVAGGFLLSETASGLPATGFPVGAFMGTAAGLLGLGGLFVVLRRRSRANPA